MSTNARPRGASATIYSVAEAAGVSIATVSRVLQQPDRVRQVTRLRVLDAVEALQYLPHGGARSLASRQHEAHGLVLPELEGPYYSELLMGYECAAAEEGQSVVLLLAEGKTDVDAAVRRLAANVDGIVVMGAVGVTPRTLAAVGRRIPVLGLASGEGTSLESFGTENRASAESLTRHLMAAHGRRRLVFVGSPDAAPDVCQRYEGFVAAHDGVDVGPAVPTAFREADGRAVAGLILAGELTADALVCANDELALAVIDRLTRGGCRVPEDVAVVGWDDVMAARYVRPALTTVRQPVRELGSRVATRLHRLIAGEDPGPQDHTLSTTVVIRESCGCPARTPSPVPNEENRP
jgi:LacI family transcriptional regulator